VRILVRSTNWVGDAVMSIPALRALRARHPSGEIALLARPGVAELFQGQGLADRLIAFEHNGRHRGALGVERLAAELRVQRFDCAILLQNAFEAAWIARRAGIPQRFGYAGDARAWLLTRAVSVPRAGEIPPHECYYYLELLRRCGWLERLPEVSEILLKVEPDALARAEEKLAGIGTRMGKLRVAVSPGAAYGSAKSWPPERFAAMADRLIAECDADVLLFGAVADRAIAARIAAAMKGAPVNLTGETGMAELPALFAACDVFAGNDSGAMHVAAGVGLPVVAVFGSTDPAGTAPVTERKTLVQQHVSCSPCFLRHCPVDHRCMERIEVDTVFSAVRKWLETGAGSR